MKAIAHQPEQSAQTAAKPAAISGIGNALVLLRTVRFALRCGLLTFSTLAMLSVEAADEYKYSGVENIDGVRLGMTVNEARGVVASHKLTNYDELSQHLSFSERKVNWNFGGSRDNNYDIPNTDYLNEILTDNRPPPLAGGKLYPNFYEVVGGHIDFLQILFSPVPGGEEVIGINHGVTYDWDREHKGMLFSNLAEAVKQKYGVALPSLRKNNLGQNVPNGIAAWSVTSTGKQLLTDPVCYIPIPAPITPTIYQKRSPITVQNYAMTAVRGGISGGRGTVGRMAQVCGPEILSVFWRVQNPQAPVNDQIVIEYSVQLLSPTLELKGVNKAFEIMNGAAAKLHEQGTSGAAQTKPTF